MRRSMLLRGEIAKKAGRIVGCSELEDRQERELIEWIASELGISVDELTRQDFDVDEMGGTDGAVDGYRVTFGEGADPEVLRKIKGLHDGSWVKIGIPPDLPEMDWDAS